MLDFYNRMNYSVKNDKCRNSFTHPIYATEFTHPKLRNRIYATKYTQPKLRNQRTQQMNFC